MNKLLIGSAGIGKTRYLINFAKESSAKNVIVVDKFKEYQFLRKEKVQNKKFFFFNPGEIKEMEKLLTELREFNESTLVIFDDCLQNEALNLFKTSTVFNWDICYATQVLPVNAESFLSNIHKLLVFNIIGEKILDELVRFGDLEKEEIMTLKNGKYVQLQTIDAIIQ
ncbi:hypothetical protein ABES38_08965 [Bacillus gobiensis]|uniref:hypothetical protein n=1 Tax=Bacillus gobiensis TaxID=1441095 RepID=UPI003D24EFC2